MFCKRSERLSKCVYFQSDKINITIHVSQRKSNYDLRIYSWLTQDKEILSLSIQKYAQRD